MKHLTTKYFQSAIFGFNDALVSTTGVIVGISTGTGRKEVVVLAGVVTILVEALSMGAGQYVSSKSADELNKDLSSKSSILSGLIMFFAYLTAGLVPLLSIVFFPISYSAAVAVAASLICLLVLGYVKGKIVKVSPLRSALEVFIIGGVATAIGIIAGNIFSV